VIFREKRPSAALYSKPESSHTIQYAAVRASSYALHIGIFDEKSPYGFFCAERRLTAILTANR
jgi:hypothetical protein